MFGPTDASGQSLPDADRLTRFGRALRSTSLDEQPRLLNLLKDEKRLLKLEPVREGFSDPDQATMIHFDKRGANLAPRFPNRFVWRDTTVPAVAQQGAWEDG